MTGHRWVQRAPSLAGYSVAVSWVLLLFFAYQPGTMSNDSFSSWEQALTGQFGNWHPPAMAVLMALPARSVGSPWPLLLLQLAALSMGVVSLAVDPSVPFQRRAGATALACACLLLPTTWTMAVAHWKDVEFAVFFLLAALLFSKRRLTAAATVVVLGSTVRHNAIFAVLPLAVYMAWRMLQKGVRHWIAAALAAGLVAGALGAPRLVEKAVGASDEWTLGALLVFDLTALYVQHPEGYPRSLLAAQVELSRLRSRYSPDRVSRLIWPDDGVPGLQMPQLANQRRPLFREWLDQIAENPVDYLRHRYWHFGALMSIDRERVCYPYQAGIITNAFGLEIPADRPLYRAFRGFADARSNSWLFRAWVWAALATLVAGVALLPRIGSPLAAAVSASGALYAGSYFIIGVSCDFRFVYWTVLSVFVSLVILIREGFCARPVSAAAREDAAAAL